jgi:predicted GNAT superfamily acetyltransferase
MRVDLAALRQQAWRADKLYDDFIRFAKSIGCTVIHDEIMSDHEQARAIAVWWTEHTS